VLLHCRKFSAHQEMRPPEFSPNKFGAQKKFVTNHWLKPVAWLVVGATSKIPCYGLQSVVDDEKPERRL